MRLLSNETDGTRREATGAKGMVATSQPLATLTAVDILSAGGTAVDAAIAANAMLGLVEPTGCGIGGDLFAIVWDPAENSLSGLNASGRSPASLSLDEMRARCAHHGVIPTEGPLSVSVPGCVSGWYALHERFGRIPMHRLLAPAILRAHNGFPLTPVIAEEWKSDVERFRQAESSGYDAIGFLRTYAPDGRAPRTGESFTNPDLASAYEALAGGGWDTFYRGAVAEQIVRCVQGIGGYLSGDDLAAHRAEWVDPVSVTYRGYEVVELPPNGQGLAVLQMLNILEGFDLGALGFGSSEAVPLMVEAKKLVYEDRARYYADPDFVDAPVAGLLSTEHADALRGLIRRDRAWPGDGVFPEPPGGGDTVCLSVADPDGMMVSLIQSNYMGMGSGLVPYGLGFGIQNRGALFSLEDDHANVFAPGKRPFHTIIPAFVLSEGKPLLVFGVMGGAMQPQGHVQILTNLFDFGMSLQQAGDAPRWRHTGSSRPTGSRMTDGGEVLVEPGIFETIVEALKRKGHSVRAESGVYGGYQAIAVDPDSGLYVGASESRKDGMALGI
ncbi:MAG: gamma-glutamyltransferase family protein [Bacteroidetes bacterium]|nr:gamma-glutamyltransferase family protein [Bacteroidota bacterium]